MFRLHVPVFGLSVPVAQRIAPCTSGAQLSRRVCLPLGSKVAGWLFLSDGTAPPPPTVPPGAALLDLEQTTLPGIAHLVVETMIVSDQIRPEDRASVLRTLLLKHRCQGGGLGGGLLVPVPFQEHRLSCAAF